MIESTAVVGNDNGILFSQDELYLAVDFKADVDGSSIEEHYFTKVIQFFDKDGFTEFSSWV